MISAYFASSSVLLKASIRWCGSFLINPTVSVRRISCVPSSCKALVVVSSVEKSMASSKIPAFVNAFSILLFPADVYPTSAATFIPDWFRWLRSNSLCRSTSASSFFRRLIRSRIRRRSISSFFSPGPLVPIPPPSLDSDLPIPDRRDARYLSWASSTWIFPSPDTALAAKISRIRSVLSSTLQSSSSSRLPSWVLLSSSSQMIPVASVSHNSSFNSISFPRPI